MQFDGLRPYENVKVVKAINPAKRVGGPGGPGSDDVNPINLKPFLGQGLYSLQVAVFDEEGGKQFREAAEAHARQLREEGYDAYYYHAQRSTVTVGLFLYEEAFTQEIGVADRYSPLVRALQERFPHNLFNGVVILERADGRTMREQPSIIINLR